MAEDREKDAPSLEPPSLFGRKKKSAPAKPPAPSAEGPDDSPTTIFDDTSEPTPDLAPTQVQEPVQPSASASPLTPPPAPAKEPRPPREPWLAGRPAAVLTGLVVGGLIVAATAGSLRLCTEVKGTSSCGGPGFFLLVAILVVAVLVGTGLLRVAHVPEPGSTSFLAVGLLSVVALLFLVGSIFEWWMAIVIPLASVATFLLSHWVTATYIDPANDGSDPDREPEPHDVR
jgi:hypothetical protein